MTKPTRALLFGAVTIILVVALGRTIETTYLIMAANVWAAVILVQLMLHYQRTTDWADTGVGRTTMAMKAALLMLVSVGILRRSQEWLTDYGYSTAARVVDAAGDAMVASSWLVLAVVLTARLRVVKALQDADTNQPEPPR